MAGKLLAVVHAYSRANAGDGLLVDLTLDRLRRIGVSPDHLVVLAMDPGSFEDLPHVVQLGTAGRKADWATVRAAVQGAAVTGARTRGLTEAGAVLRAADGFVAVGGGYLRAGGAVNRVGTAINHLPVLRAVASSGKPSVYLPQSVGPLHGMVGRRVRGLLGRVGEVNVRDDRSREELRGLPNIRRTPDLAVLAAAESFTPASIRQSGGNPVLVARALGGAAESYSSRLLALATDLRDAVWAVQAEGSVEKSDRTFYTGLGVRSAGLLTELIGSGCGPVVSVRLHGALQAIMSGVPAVHLGYERKSWGAYADLGLDRWVHDARSFEPRVVAAQVRALREDPTDFWSAIEARGDGLRASSRELDESLRRTFGQRS